MIDLYIRDKYHNTIHRIGDNPHDCLTVDKEGTVHYSNLQNGDGCIGFMSVNQETLKDVFPEKDWGARANEYTHGYEFVPNEDEYGYPLDPIGRAKDCWLPQIGSDLIKHGIARYECSNCHRTVSQIKGHLYPYCPMCGMKMEGEK